MYDLRLNEAGDLYSQADVVKVDRIAELLAAFGVVVYLYTARRDLDFSDVKYALIKGSGFDGPNGQAKVISKKDFGKYKGEGGWFVCPNNCKVCNVCLKRDGRNILFFSDRKKAKKAKKALSLYIKHKGMEIKLGNRKLPISTAVLNMGPVADCPAKALGLCQVDEVCYAEGPERQYPAVLAYRERQAEYWHGHNADQISQHFLEALSLN